MKHKSRFQLFSRITIFEISRRNRELANFVDERKSIPTLSSCLRSFFFPLFKGRNEKIVEKESEEGTREDSIDALIKPVLPRKSRNIRIAARFYLAWQEKVRFVVDYHACIFPPFNFTPSPLSVHFSKKIFILSVAATRIATLS